MELLQRDSGQGAQSGRRQGRRRAHTLTHVFFVLFCLEIGFVLLLLPWTNLWDSNYFSSLMPAWNHLWVSTYLRGAISGIGLVNMWIGVSEAWRMWH